MREEISKAVDELVEMIAKDPLSNSCAQINYSNYVGDSSSQMNSSNSMRHTLLGNR